MATQPDDIDHWHTDELVCPYCGWISRDSWEVARTAGSDDSGTAECEAEDCGKTFKFRVDTTIEYTTERMPDHAE